MWNSWGKRDTVCLYSILWNSFKCCREPDIWDIPFSTMCLVLCLCALLCLCVYLPAANLWYTTGPISLISFVHICDLSWLRGFTFFEKHISLTALFYTIIDCCLLTPLKQPVGATSDRQRLQFGITRDIVCDGQISVARFFCWRFHSGIDILHRWCLRICILSPLHSNTLRRRSWTHSPPCTSWTPAHMLPDTPDRNLLSSSWKCHNVWMNAPLDLLPFPHVKAFESSTEIRSLSIEHISRWQIIQMILFIIQNSGHSHVGPG